MTEGIGQFYCFTGHHYNKVVGWTIISQYNADAGLAVTNVVDHKYIHCFGIFMGYQKSLIVSGVL